MSTPSKATELQFGVIGAAEPKKYFSALTKENLAHGYLFTGPQGVGKKTFARRFAQSLLCEAPKEHVLGYDGTCGACRLVEKKIHPDVIETNGPIRIGERDSAIGFYGDEMTSRDLVRQFSLQSYAGGMRIFIFGDADFASPAAANALLKFFEEPPLGVILLLTTATPGRLLPTIRSRLCEVPFPSLSRAEIEQILVSQSVSPKDARSAARIGQGSVTRALAALAGEQESLRALAIGWFFEVVRGGSPESSWATRETLDEGLEVLKTLVRDWSAASLAGKAMPMLAPDCAAAIGKLPPLAQADSLRLLARLTDAQKIARTNVSPSLVCEMVRMHLSGLAVNSGEGTPPRRTALR